MPHSVTPETESEQIKMEDISDEGSNAGDNQNMDEEDDVMMVGSGDGASGTTTATTTSTPPEIKPEVKKEVKLDDLFADDDLDEAFGDTNTEIKLTSSQQDTPAPSSPVQFDAGMSASDPEVMRAFYQRLFPWRYLFQWLNHSPNPTTDFAHREFAFTLQNDAYLRYQSFPTSDLLRKDVLRLNPSRFEIGPVYSANPRDRKTLREASSFKPLSKELCFDIDLTDYDGIRTCCDKANICNKCWQFITMAIKVVDVALRDDFGFKHIMWVYSGRRGAHAWVCDKKARMLADNERKAVVNYLHLVAGGAGTDKKVNLRRPLHPHIARSLNVLKTHFQTDILEDQDPWEETDKAERLLKLLPDRALNEALRKKWNSAPGRTSASKWADIDTMAKSVGKALDTKALLEAKQDIVLEYTYPRLDVEVSKKLNHLLKSPFVVHPGTGRVCVPIDTARLEAFDPLSVPTVTQLLQEIDQWSSGENGEDGKKLQDWEKTSLKPFVDSFRSFVAGLLRDEVGAKVKRERVESSAGAMEF